MSDERSRDESGEPSKPEPFLAKVSLRPAQTPEPARMRERPTRSRASQAHERSRLHTPQVLILGFGLIIALGTLLLRLPAASANGESIGWDEALFTATSAATVTGLVVLDTGQDFTRLGQAIILLLIQVGGVGFVAFSVLLFRLIGRRVSLNERFIVQESLGVPERTGVVRLALFVLGITLLLEAVGALLLWLRWRTVLPEEDALWYALFHAVSSYCNAGFDLFSSMDRGPIFGFGRDYATLGIMAGLILLGSFGIAVLYDVGRVSWRQARGEVAFLDLNSRITLLFAFFLALAGTGIMLLDRRVHDTVMAGFSTGEQIAVSLFTVIAARTAGLTILPVDQLSEATQFVLMLWMFIGGAPASMAGGISSSAAGVLIIAVVATIRGHPEAVFAGRTLPRETIRKAMSIVVVSLLLVLAVTLALSLLKDGRIFLEGFEVVSAFSNTGYSLGYTAELDLWGRLLIIFTMFWGRLGPLTIVVALTQSEQPKLVSYPEEPVILG